MKTRQECTEDVKKAMDEFIDAFLWDCGPQITDPISQDAIVKWLREHAFNFASKATGAALGQGFTPDNQL